MTRPEEHCFVLLGRMLPKSHSIGSVVWMGLARDIKS